MKEILFICLLCSVIGFVLSILMIKRYLWESSLSSKWKLTSGPNTLWNDIVVYKRTTEQENGRIGVWFNLIGAFYGAMMVSALNLAILQITKCRFDLLRFIKWMTCASTALCQRRRVARAFSTLQPIFHSHPAWVRCDFVGSIDKDGDAGNYYFPAITFPEIFILQVITASSFGIIVFRSEVFRHP